MLFVLLGMVLLVGGGLGFLFLRKPAQVAASTQTVARTPERIARGEFLFLHVAECSGCHSQRDFTRVGGPEVPAGRGRGSVLSDFLIGLPGVVVAPNITPDAETGIGAWTDGEKIRAIRDGVDKSGNALFPMMPYQMYRQMSDEDVEALVAYLDTMPLVRNPLPKTSLAFPANVLIKSAPRPAGSVPSPDRGDRLRYGKYLAAVAGCVDCHTPAEKGERIAGMEFAGGQVFASQAGTVVSANLTPDLETGIGRWSEEFFQKKIYEYKDYAAQGPPPLSGPQAFTLMPWLAYAGLPPDDLSAIYTFLRTVQPVHHYVETHPGAPKHPPSAPADTGR